MPMLMLTTSCMWKRLYWNPSTCSCTKCLTTINDDSVILLYEIIDVEETRTIPKNLTCKTQHLYILLAFLLITVVLLIAVNIYCYLIIEENNANIF